MPEERRQVGSISICSGTSHFQDLKTIEKIVSGYRQLGGKVPPQIEIALEAGKQGKAVEEALNTACDGLFKFYIAEQNRCAREEGFVNLEDMYKRKSNDPADGAFSNYDQCVLKVERRWQLHSWNYTINIGNKDSVLRVYLEKTRDQVLQLVAKHLKSKAKVKPNNRSR